MSIDQQLRPRRREIPFSWALIVATACTCLILFLTLKWLQSANDAQTGIAVLFFILMLPKLFPWGFAFVWPLCELIRLGWNYCNGLLNKRRLYLCCVAPCLILGIAISVHAPSARDCLSRYRMCSIARSEQTDANTLSRLYEHANDPYDHDLLMPIAANSRTPSAILNILAKDKYTSIRSRIARNPSTPADTLKMLTHDKDEHVQNAARRRTKMHVISCP
jgi:hypothetical protein